ncbi:translocation/assembly module TamB domain-containing protein [Rhodospirillaceae bacterium SYSU D60014]|uniref:translocation/assembly module TamB domain-containing protein n=1 Tax=Virgifigura deserti TaxID=2268457 RepID=UPI000E6739E2
MGFLVYLLPIVLAIVLGVAQFDFGKRQLAWLVELGLAPGNDVAFGDFSGSPFDLRLDDLTIRDAEGVWFDLDGFRFSWAPSALFRGRLAIEELSASSLTLERLPDAETAPPEPEERKPFEIPGLPTGLLGIAVDRLAVETLTLGAPLLGERAVFTVDGRLQTTDPREQFEIALRLDRRDEPTARLAATASLAPREGSAPVLTADLEAEETGGLVAGLAGTPPGTDLILSLKGAAPVTDWHGRLAGAAGGLGRVDADLTLQAAADLSAFAVAADGTLDIEPRLLPAGAAPLLDPETRFALRLRRPAEDDAGGDRLVVEAFKVTTGAATAEAEAQIDLAAQTTEGTFHLNVPALKAFEKLANTPLAGRMAASGRFSGPLRLPELTVDLSVDDLQAAGVAATRFAGKVQFADLDEASEESSGFRLDAGGRIEGLAVDGAPLQGQDDFVWMLDADLPKGGAVDLHQLSLTSQSVALTVAGQLDGERFGLDATVDVLDLERLAALDPAGDLAELPTAPRLHVEAEGSLAEPRKATVKGQLDRLDPLPPALAALLGNAVTFAADASLANGSDLTLSDITVDGQAADLTAEAAIDLAAKDLQARFGLAVPRLAVLSPAVAPDLAGSLRIDGEATGPLGNPMLTATADGRQLALAGQRFDQALATVRAEALTAEPEGKVDLALTRGQDRVALATGFALRSERSGNQQLILSSIGFDPGVDVEGEVAIDLGRFLADGALRIEAADLDPLTRFFGLELGGGIALDLRLDPEDGGQRLAADLSGSNLSGPFGAIGQVTVSADIRNAFADPEGQAEIALADLRHAAVQVDRLTADLRGRPQRIAFAAIANGTARDPFEVDLAGSFAAAPDGTSGLGTLALDRLDGRYAGEPISLVRPVTVRLRDGGLAIDQLSMMVAGGRVDASGGFSPSSIDLQAEIADLPLALAERFGGPSALGSASAMLTVTGTPQRPQAEIAATATGIAFDDPAFRDAPSLDLHLDAGFRDETLRIALRASHLFETPITATATIPLTLSLQPFAASVPQSGALDGRLRAEAELSRLVSLLLLDDQRLDGRLDIDLGLTGTVAAPRLDGHARIADGLYQNLATGTVLADIDAALAAQGTEITVERLKATDGGKGTISGSGRIDLAAVDRTAGGGFPFTLDLRFANAVLVRLPEGVAEAGGALTFNGNLGGDALLSGDVSVGPAEIRIPDRLPPSVVDLDVIEISETGEIITEPAPSEDLLAADAISLQLNVNASRVFVRGRGLESEWEGGVRIGGTAAAPQIVGKLEVERGTMDLLGNRLNITRGIISFPGARPPAPNIDVAATSDLGDGVIAEVAVRGDATAPELAISSQPPLPEDEVLARLLFGRDIASITPVQAIKLAAAVSTLRGGGGLDLVGEARNLLGVDVLDLRTTERAPTVAEDGTEEPGGTTTSVAVGKYLTDDIFVEYEQGLGREDEGGAVSVEIEVTPNITIDTEVGANSQTGAGIKWRYDY